MIFCSVSRRGMSWWSRIVLRSRLVDEVEDGEIPETRETRQGIHDGTALWDFKGSRQDEKERKSSAFMINVIQRDYAFANKKGIMLKSKIEKNNRRHSTIYFLPSTSLTTLWNSANSSLAMG